LRSPPVAGLVAAFALLVAVVAGRRRGLRALVGLGLSLAMIIGFVVPAIAGGSSPVAVVTFGALGVMLLTIPLVHGGGAKSLAACLGTAAALGLTLALAQAVRPRLGARRRCRLSQGSDHRVRDHGRVP
jgi:uncharacterized membrane protein